MDQDQERRLRREKREELRDRELIRQDNERLRLMSLQKQREELLKLERQILNSESIGQIHILDDEYESTRMKNNSTLNESPEKSNASGSYQAPNTKQSDKKGKPTERTNVTPSKSERDESVKLRDQIRVDNDTQRDSYKGSKIDDNSSLLKWLDGLSLDADEFDYENSTVCDNEEDIAISKSAIGENQRSKTFRELDKMIWDMEENSRKE